MPDLSGRLADLAAAAATTAERVATEATELERDATDDTVVTAMAGDLARFSRDLARRSGQIAAFFAKQKEDPDG